MDDPSTDPRRNPCDQVFPDPWQALSGHRRRADTQRPADEYPVLCQQWVPQATAPGDRLWPTTPSPQTAAAVARGLGVLTSVELGMINAATTRPDHPNR